MAAITHSVEIDRRPEDVFAYATDPSKLGEWQEDVISSSAVGDGPLGPGKQLVQTRRLGPGKQELVSEVTAWDPPRVFGFRGVSGPIRAVGEARIDPLDDGQRSRVSLRLDFEGKGVGKLLVPLVHRQAAKAVPVAHAKLKQNLESGRG